MSAIWQQRKRSLSFFVCEPCEREDVEFFAIQATGDNIFRLMSTSAQAMKLLIPFIRFLFWLRGRVWENRVGDSIVFICSFISHSTQEALWPINSKGWIRKRQQTNAPCISKVPHLAFSIRSPISCLPITHGQLSSSPFHCWGTYLLSNGNAEKSLGGGSIRERYPCLYPSEELETVWNQWVFYWWSSVSREGGGRRFCLFHWDFGVRVFLIPSFEFICIFLYIKKKKIVWFFWRKQIFINY